MRKPLSTSTARLGASLLGLACCTAGAADTTEVAAIGNTAVISSPAAVEMETVTVTATRLPVASFDVPASISTVSGEDLYGNTLGVNLSEALVAIPGLIARDRQNYAQDTQISIRGFGSRATFGVRGLRLYLDGIPATQPDGQGQVSHFNLGSAERVEVLRGPFSSMYGNSSGGVIQMFTADGAGDPMVGGAFVAGSFGTQRSSITMRSSVDPARTIDYIANYMRFDTDGFRDHSAAKRESFNTKLNWQISEASRLSLVLNTFSSPDTQDPLGLTRAQFDADPSQATVQATQFNTRKSAEQNQGGLIYDLRLSSTQSVRVLGYYGERAVEQYLAIPAATQGNPRHGGGVVDLSTQYGGTDARWTYEGLLGGRQLTLVAGLNYDELSQHRLGYNNFVGSELGVRGALRRDERNVVGNLDQYLQASVALTERFTLMAGARHSRVDIESRDRYIVGANRDDSGNTDYSATTPVAGLTYRANDALRLYASYGRGFETPTLAEAAYRPDGNAGLNLDLEAARSNNAEVGAKLRLQPGTLAELAVFHTDTRDELAVATNSGGRSTFRNIDETRRQGAEASVTTLLAKDLRLQLAYTWLDATVRQPYATCVGTPCTAANATVARGSRIAGAPEHSGFAGLNFGGRSGLNAELDARYIDSVFVNDVNSESAPSYTLIGAGLGYIVERAHWRLRGFLRADNLFDKDYVGSVIVNDGNGRFYEPGPGRSVLAGVNLDWNG